MESKKELTFTFYDLEGKGKISEDDILSLVRGVFGAAKDLLAVPNQDQKSIRLSLTLTPSEDLEEGKDENAEKNNNIPLTFIKGPDPDFLRRVTIRIKESRKKKACDNRENDNTRTAKHAKNRGIRSRSQPPDLHELLRLSLEENNVCYSHSQRYSKTGSSDKQKNYQREDLVLGDTVVINECDDLEISRSLFCKRHRHRSKSHDVGCRGCVRSQDMRVAVNVSCCDGGLLDRSEGRRRKNKAVRNNPCI